MFNVDLYGLRLEELENTLYQWGFSAYHTRLLWRYLYRDRVSTYSEMNQLRSDLLEELRQTAVLNPLAQAAAIDSKDGKTRKLLLRLPDGHTIESVFMKYQGRATVCVSTQVGCAMRCVFCATGQMGFIRNLTVSEIVAQVVEAKRYFDSQNEDLRNVVFMGMGEPLHNYANTLAAIDILTDDLGLAVAPRGITVSTIGLVPGIKDLAHDNQKVNLAVSLHAANDDHRSQLVPINSRWSLNELIDACRYYSDKTGRRIFFEWTMIAGNNDGAHQAHELGQLISGLQAHVNLIPYNPTAEFSGEPSDHFSCRKFQSILRDYGIPSTVRQRRGIDIHAGCGQLRTSYSETTK